jgi:trehalose 6-phosphate phosphatase
MSINLMEHLHILDDVARTRGRLFLALDFDGTLAPIADAPGEVELKPQMNAVLGELARCNHVSIAVVSGRSIYDLARRIHLPDVILAGNHGLEIVAPQWTYTCPDAVTFQNALSAISAGVSRAITYFHGAWVENKRLTATVHYRQVDATQHESLKRVVRTCVVGASERFAIRSGKMALEIRPRVAWDKGSAVQLIRCRNGLEAAPMICIGDDRTDESMFLRFPDATNIVVGSRPDSAAAYHVADSDEVYVALSLLSDFVSNAERRHERFSRRSYAAETAWARLG